MSRSCPGSKPGSPTASAGGIRRWAAARDAAPRGGADDRRSDGRAPAACGGGFIQGAFQRAHVDAFSPSPEQVEEAAAEFRARFGQGHTLKVIHDKDAGFLVRSTTDIGSSRTVLNTIEPPVTRAMFAYARALAAEEYAQLHGDWRLRWTKIESAATDACTTTGVCSCDEKISNHLHATIIHTSCMTTHEHAADYVRFEHAKYAHLHMRYFPTVIRGVALLSRAYIGSAAKRHGVRVDVGEITAGMRLGGADRMIIRAARRVLNSVHRQRVRGSRVDVVDYTRDLDDAFALLEELYAAD